MVVMQFASDGDRRCNAALFQGGYVGRAEVASIQRPGRRCAQGIGQGIQRWFHFRLIVGMVGQRVGHNQQTVVVRRDWGIVRLVKAIGGAVFHDARVGIGAVVLIPVTWPVGWLGLRPTRFTRARFFSRARVSPHTR